MSSLFGAVDAEKDRHQVHLIDVHAIPNDADGGDRTTQCTSLHYSSPSRETTTAHTAPSWRAIPPVFFVDEVNADHQFSHVGRVACVLTAMTVALMSQLHQRPLLYAYADLLVVCLFLGFTSLLTVVYWGGAWPLIDAMLRRRHAEAEALAEPMRRYTAASSGGAMVVNASASSSTWPVNFCVFGRLVLGTVPLYVMMTCVVIHCVLLAWCVLASSVQWAPETAVHTLYMFVVWLCALALAVATLFVSPALLQRMRRFTAATFAGSSCDTYKKQE